MSSLDIVDIGGNLETISNLALIGIILIQVGKVDLIPTILEDLMGHIQRLTLEYAVKEE